IARTTVGSIDSMTPAAWSRGPSRSSRGRNTCSRRVPGAALSVWTSKGNGKEGRIRGPWWAPRTLDIHLTPGIRAPGNPGSLTLSCGPARLPALRGAPAPDPCAVCGALWRLQAGTPHTLQMTRQAGEQARVGRAPGAADLGA
uniref:Uncharacterized protein n=1 Tax=Peromyscus maniculatus bairdii TaxID=230844 RepID=A0A8C8UDA9_PERMB